MKVGGSSIGCALALILAPCVAQADDPPRLIEDLRLGSDDDGYADRIAGSLAVNGFLGEVDDGHARSDRALLVSFDVGLRIGFGREARFRANWGVAYGLGTFVGTFTTTSSSTTYVLDRERVEARNPDFVFEWVPTLAPGIRFGAGIGAAIAMAGLTSIPIDTQTQADLDSSYLVHATYAASHGMWNDWRYRAERIGLFVPLTLAIELTPETVFRAEAAAAIGVPVIGTVRGEGNVDGTLQAAVEIGHAVTPELRLGGQAALVAHSLGQSSEGVQPSIAPWARLELGHASALARVTLPLGGDHGLGSWFPAWGVMLAIQAHD